MYPLSEELKAALARELQGKTPEESFNFIVGVSDYLWTVVNGDGATPQGRVVR